MTVAAFRSGMGRRSFTAAGAGVQDMLGGVAEAPVEVENSQHTFCLMKR